MCFPEQGHLVLTEEYQSSLQERSNPRSSTPAANQHPPHRIPGSPELTGFNPSARRATMAQINDAIELREVLVHRPAHSTLHNGINLTELG